MTLIFPWHVDYPLRRIKTAAELREGIELFELHSRALPHALAALAQRLRAMPPRSMATVIQKVAA